MMLRNYQDWAVKETWRYFAEHIGNPVIAMPTGTGKSHVIAGLLQSMLFAFPNTRAMMLTHVKELIQQNYNKFLQSWPNAPVGIYSAGLNKKELTQQITFGGIASVVKKATQFGHIDLLFIDECDLVSPNEATMYSRFVKILKIKNPHLKVIGLTATPWRAGLGAITNEGGLFTDVCVDMCGVDAFNWFITEGYLVPLIPKRTKLELDVSGVHMRGGEFVEKELQLAVDKIELTRNALRESLAIAHDRHKWLVFASGVQHAKHIAEELVLMDIPAAAVYSGMEKDGLDRDEIIKKFKTGEFRAIVNNNILTTGFDEPGIDFILILRPTGSSRLWVQMLGRGTRPVFVEGFDLNTTEGRLASIAASIKKNCLVMDFSDNIRRLGPINDPVIPKMKGKGPPGEAPIKLCLMCNTYNHSSARFCFNCGNEFIFETKLKMYASTEPLIKQDLPIEEHFKVDHITYTLHHKVGAQPMIRVTYYSNLRNFTEYVCCQHPDGNFALKKAKEWWRRRTQDPMPRMVNEALEIIGKLKAPTHLRVWTNTKYPQIMGHCFDGSDFGKVPATQAIGVVIPDVSVTTHRDSDKYDIPF